MADKEIVLVLHHTYFHNTFRSYPEFSPESFNEFKSCRFIARFIIEKKTDNTSAEIATSTKKAYGDFFDDFEKKANTYGAFKFKKILEKLIYLADSDDIVKLDKEEGVIAWADKIYSTSNDYEPILVVTKEAKDKFNQKAIAFYKATLGEKFTTIPFRILSVEEAEKFLVDRYANICSILKERMGDEPF
jgi:hypothetical protein